MTIASVPSPLSDIGSAVVSGATFAARLFSAQATVAAAATPSITVVTPGGSTHKIGDQFQVNIALDTHGSAITGWQLGLDYDPSILSIATTSSRTPPSVGAISSWFADQAASIGASPFTIGFKLSQDGRTTTPGHVSIGGQTMTGQPADTGISGAGTLVSFTFTALAGGSSPITIHDVKLTDPSARVLDVSVAGAQSISVDAGSPASPTATSGSASTAAPTSTPTLTPSTPGTSTPTSTATSTATATSTSTPAGSGPTTTPTAIGGGFTCGLQKLPAAPGTSMTLSGPSSMQVGETAQFTVILDPGTRDSFGFQFGLSYDSTIVQVPNQVINGVDSGQPDIAVTDYYAKVVGSDSVNVKPWSKITDGIIGLGGLNLINVSSGVPSAGAKGVAQIKVKALKAGDPRLVMTCPYLAQGVGDPTNVTGVAVFSPDKYSTATFTVVAQSATDTPTPIVTATPTSTPPSVGKVTVESKTVNLNDTFTVNVSISNLEANRAIRGATFGVISEPSGIVKVTGIDVGSMFTSFANSSHGDTSYGVLPGFKIDSSGNVPVPGAISLQAVRGSPVIGPTGGVVATIKLQAVKSGSARLRLLVLEPAPSNKQILDQMGIVSVLNNDPNPAQPRSLINGWVNLSGGQVTVGSATSVPTASASASATGTVTSVTGSVTPTSGPTSIGGVNVEQVGTPSPTPTPPRASSGSTLGFLPISTAAKSGDSFSVDVVLNADQEVRGVQFGLTFNSSVLQVDHVDIGPFFKSWADANGASVANLPSWDPNNRGGSITVGGLVLLGGPLDAKGPSGNGSVAKIFFKAVADGNSQLTLTDTKLAIQVGTATQSVPLTSSAGTVVVGAGAQATVAALTAASGVAANPAAPGVVLVDPVTGAPVAGSPLDPGVPGQAPLITFDSAGNPIASSGGAAPEVAGVQSAAAGRPGQTVAGGPAANVTRAGTTSGSAASSGTGADGTPRPLPTSTLRTPDAYVSPTVPAAAGTRTGTPTPTGTRQSFAVPSTPVTFDISKSIDSHGVIMEPVRLASPDGRVRLFLHAGTVALTGDRRPLRTIQISAAEDLPVLPDDVVPAGGGFDFGPSGATFNPAITIAIPYDPGQLPESMAPDNVEPAFFDVLNGNWVSLSGAVDTTDRSVSTQVTHFTTFAVLTKHGGVNWALVAGIILLELGLGLAAAFFVPRWLRRRGTPASFPGWLHMPHWPWWPRRPRRGRKPRLAVAATTTRKGEAAHSSTSSTRNPH